MAKKLVKKRKIKIFHFLIFLIIIGILVFFAYVILNSPIKNINISGNTYLSDEEIIEKAGIKDYPSFFLTLSNQIKQNIEKIPIVKNVVIKKGVFNVLTVEVQEYRVILKNGLTGQYILENGKELALENECDVPKLTNSVVKEKYQRLIDEFLIIHADVLEKISEVKYVPNEYDKDRFLLYMSDGNSVYLTLTKFEMINYYNQVLQQLEGKKGILYLDSGNHFKIME